MIEFAVLKYELINAVRSRWLFAYTFLLMAMIFSFSYLIDNPGKVQLLLVSVLTPLVPLVSVLFTTSYWYSQDRFTTLLLSQPVGRPAVFWSRLVALIISLSVSLSLALIVPAVVLGFNFKDTILLFCALVSAGAIFSCISAIVVTSIVDRMWGLGLGFAIWFYFMALHDALQLLVLYWFREYPLERISAAICALNPLSLIRVSLLMYLDAPLLLGHSGALIRRLVETGSGFYFTGILLLLWALVPALIGVRRFRRRDF